MRSRFSSLIPMAATLPILGALLGASPVLAQSSSRPNIVVIVSDDHGFGDVGWNDPEVKTPHLDRLAKEGVRLDRFYANPICSVTRAALFSGVSSLRTGVNNRNGLSLDYGILPEFLRGVGYQTWMFGKWHLGGTEDNRYSGPEYLPQRRGFDYFYGHLHGAVDYYSHKRKDLDKLDWQRNGEPVNETGFTTDLLADDAIRMVKQREPDRPFLLYLAFNAVHGPIQPPPSAPDLSKRNKRELLLANVTHMDAAIGRLLNTIDKEGLRKNTLVLFFGDNGGQLSQGASNGPLRGEKGNTFEGGIRVPAAIRWDGVVQSGSTSGQFISVMDVLPTLCAAANVKLDESLSLDGQNLWPAIASGKVTPHPPFVMGNKDVACFAEPWKLVTPPGGEPPMLYHILNDPKEQQNVAADHPEIVAELVKHVSSIEPATKPGKDKNAKGGRKQKKTKPETSSQRNEP